MTFRGTVENGKIIIEGDVPIADGTRVDIRPLRGKAAGKEKGKGGLMRLTGFAVRTGVRDLATQHDHYVYGTPKRLASGSAHSRKGRGKKGRTKTN